MVSGRPIQLFLTPAAKIQVFDLKTGMTGHQTMRFTNAFVQIEYPNPRTAPEATGGRRVKRTCLMIPVANGWVLAEPTVFVNGIPAPNFFSGFTAELQVLRDMVEYW